MKTSLPILTILIFLSCHNKSKLDNLKKTPEVGNKKEMLDELIGDWGIYVSGNAYCNACPRIIFRVDGTGTITYPNGENEHIAWKRKKDTLEIKNISTTSDGGKLSDGEYSMEFEREGITIGLTLMEITSSYHYKLRREKRNGR